MKQIDVPPCEETKVFMRRIVNGEARGTLVYLVPLVDTKVKRPGYTHVDYWDSPEKFLEQRLATLARKRWGHDHAVPLLDPSAYGGGILATAFGAHYDPSYNYTLPCITSSDQIKSLPLDRTLKHGLIPKALETINYITSEIRGQLPVQMYNTGGPLDILSMVTGYEQLIEAMFLYPETVHRLLNHCTQLFIDFIMAQKEIISDFVPMLLADLYWPDGMGLLFGADWLNILSPEMALEFEIPYINRISDAFGGVVVHSDKMPDYAFELLKTHVRNLRGVHCNGGESSIPKMIEIFRGTDVVLMTRLQVNKPYHFNSRLEFVKHVLSIKSPDVTIILDACRAADPLLKEKDANAISEEILRLIESYVAT